LRAGVVADGVAPTLGRGLFDLFFPRCSRRRIDKRQIESAGFGGQLACDRREPAVDKPFDLLCEIPTLRGREVDLVASNAAVRVLVGAAADGDERDRAREVGLN